MIRVRAKFLTAAPALGAIAAIAVMAAAPSAATADEGEADAPKSEREIKGEEKLAEMLEGRVAGTPVDCIRTRPSEPSVTIPATAYVYGRGKTIWVQRTLNPKDIDRNNIVVVQRFNGTRLCRMDFATTVDRLQGFFTGGVQFAEFVPYTRIDENDG